jgi:pimeloyl-ACP methyl ester carboxylesterase
MTIRAARNGDVEIAYERLGPPDATPLLLIPGSGMQMVSWQRDLCAAMVDRGFQVVLMDNRDSGLSTWLRQYDGRRGRAYSIQDMAGDVIAVIDAIGARGAYLMGGSLGATIAQVAAIHHPRRVTGLILASVCCGARLRLARPNVRTVIRMLKVMRGDTPDAQVLGQRWVDLQRLVGSPAYPLDEAHWRAAGELAYKRGVYAAGSLRHTRALMAVRDLRPQLATLTTPALVIQGRADPLMSWKAAKITADAIPGARFQLYPGVGHDLPKEIWPDVLDQITALAQQPTVDPSPA